MTTGTCIIYIDSALVACDGKLVGKITKVPENRGLQRFALRRPRLSSHISTQPHSRSRQRARQGRRRHSS